MSRVYYGGGCSSLWLLSLRSPPTFHPTARPFFVTQRRQLDLPLTKAGKRRQRGNGPRVVSIDVDPPFDVARGRAHASHAS